MFRFWHDCGRIAVLVLATAGWVNGQTYFNKTSGDWTTAGNWTGGSVPITNSDARIGSDGAGAVNPATAYIHSGEFATSGTLRVGYPVTTVGQGTLIVEGGQLNVPTRFDLGGVAKGTGVVVQTGGLVDGGGKAMYVGSGTTGKGTYSLGGSGTILTNVGLANVANGEIDVTNGAAAYFGDTGNSTVGAGNVLLLVDQAYASIKSAGYTYWGGGGSLTTLKATRCGVLDLALTGGFYLANGSGTGVVNVADGSLVKSSTAWTFANNSASRGVLYVTGSSTAQLTSATLANGSATESYVYMTNSRVTCSGTFYGAGSGKGETYVSGSYLGVTNVVYLSAGAGVGTMWASNSTLDWRSTVYAPNWGSSLLYLQAGSTALMPSVNIAWQPGSSGLVSVADSTLSCDVMTIAGANATGTIFMTNGTLICRRADVGGGSGKATLTATDSQLLLTNTASLFLVGPAAGSAATATLTRTRLVITNVSAGTTSLYIGNSGTGTLIVTDSAITNAGITVFGGAANAGGDMRLTRSRWWQGGTYIQMANYAPARASISLDASDVANMGTLYMGRSVATAQDSLSLVNSTWLNSNTVYVASVGSSSLSISNSAFEGLGYVYVDFNGASQGGTVDITGTGRSFRANILTLGSKGTVTNHVQKYAGGVDIVTNTAAGLVIAANGRIHLAFEKNPAVAGDFWGLRWAGNHVTDLAAHTNASPKRLTWDDSLLDPFYQGQVTIYTNATHTFVGFVVTKTLTRSGTMFMLR